MTFESVECVGGPWDGRVMSFERERFAVGCEIHCPVPAIGYRPPDMLMPDGPERLTYVVDETGKARLT